MKKQEVQRSVCQMKDLVQRLKLEIKVSNTPDEQKVYLNQTADWLNSELEKLERKAFTRNLLDAGLFTDEELIRFFNPELGEIKGYRLFEATYVPNGEPNRVDNWDKREFLAKNKAEAVKIAREYGARIIGKKMVYVYLANRGW